MLNRMKLVNKITIVNRHKMSETIVNTEVNFNYEEALRERRHSIQVISQYLKLSSRKYFFLGGKRKKNCENRFGNARRRKKLKNADRDKQNLENPLDE